MNIMTQYNYTWCVDEEGHAICVCLYHQGIEKLCFIIEYTDSSYDCARLYAITRVGFWIYQCEDLNEHIDLNEYIDRFYADAIGVIDSRLCIYRVYGDKAYPMPAKRPIYVSELGHAN